MTYTLTNFDVITIFIYSYNIQLVDTNVLIIISLKTSSGINEIMK